MNAKSLHRYAYKTCFPDCLLLEERPLLQEQILSFRVQISFPFRADPIQEMFLSRKANRKSQKLLFFIKMAEECGTVSSYLNVCCYTTVLYRLFCKGDNRIIYAGKGWGSTLSERKCIEKIE